MYTLFQLLCLFGLFFTIESACQAITVSLCQNIRYNSTIFPNSLGHKNQDEAGIEIHQYFPLVKIECSKDLQGFLCSVYFPMCTILEKPIPPCQSLCLSARNGCSNIMNKFGFQWPESLKCDKYPKNPKKSICIGLDNLPSSVQEIPAPRNLRIATRNGSLFLEWTEPNLQNKFNDLGVQMSIESYQVIILNRDTGETGSRRISKILSTEIGDRCSKYKFTVQAEYPNSFHEEATIEYDSTTFGMKYFRARIQNQSLTVYFNKNDILCLHYGHSVTLKGSSNWDDVEEEMKQIEVYEASHTINDLYPATSYTITIRAIDANNSQLSHWTQFRTETTTDGKPGPIEDLVVILRTSESLRIRWSPPQFLEGVIQKYWIEVTRDKINRGLDIESENTEASDLSFVSSDKNQFFIHFQTPTEDSFIIHVWAENRAHNGSKTSVQSIINVL